MGKRLVRRSHNSNAGAFNGKLNFNFRIADVESLRNGLTSLYNQLDSSFLFSTLEYKLEVKFNGNGLGKFDVDIEISNEPVHGSILQFNISIDQTYIPDLIAQLDSILKRFTPKSETPSLQ